MKVMVFGVFDGLHDGHKFLLSEAKKLGDLIVVVARDLAVQQLKNKLTINSETKRVEVIKQYLPEAKVVLGDNEQNGYEIVKIHDPDMICLGFDQALLAQDLKKKFQNIAFFTLKEFNRV